MILRAIALILVMELFACAYLFIQRAARPAPMLPDKTLMNPLFAEDIQPLVEQVTQTNNAYDWMRLGEALLGQGYYSHAELCFRQVADLIPDSRLAESRIAYCLERTGRTEQSSELYRELNRSADLSREAKREQMQALYEIGRNALREEQMEESEKLFRQNLGFLPARYQLAKLLIRTKRAQEALPVINESLQQIPGSLKFLELQHRAFLQTGDLKQAEQTAQLLERAQHTVPLHPGSSFIEPFRLQYGIDRHVEEFNTQIGKVPLPELEAKLVKLIDRLEGYPSTHRQIFLMRLLEVQHQQQLPRKMLETILKLNNMGINNADVLMYRAEATGILGDWNQAAVLGQRAGSMSKAADLHQRLADILQQAGQTDESRLEQALTYRLEAMEYYRADQLAEALNKIERAIKLNPADPQCWYDRGLIQEASGEVKASISDFQECLKRAPLHGRARQKLAVEHPDS
ncbi:tetratricopeptide repeat protein [Gimesia algae]|uniref:Tetratricopeptide repeat protein n=1 Tax=Gimesia algae TaxID=2527971 RepID=A0A517V662_9PLAN|nr:tetratricopeptide repeat protein [Gimesia algae]QDT88496.1 Tetratricopeptide repeat protein [Gimesia algae]